MTSSPPKVLVVDDDRQFRAAVAEALTDLGYAPSQVPGAQEALHELEAERYDVVLLDLRMPGLSGHDLLRRLERGIPVVAMSGTGTMDDVIAVLRRGAVDFLRKPFGPRQLEQSLRRALGEGAPPPQGAPNLRQDPTGGWSRPSHDRREAVQRVDRAGPDTAADPCHHLAQALHDGEIELPAIAPIAEDVRRNGRLIVRQAVHEHGSAGVGVEVFDLPPVDIYLLDIFTAAEPLLLVSAGRHVLELHLRIGGPFAGLYVFVLDDHPYLAVHVDRHTVSKFLGFHDCSCD